MASASTESTATDELRRGNGVARRLVRLPLDIIKGVTRAMGHRSGIVNLGSHHRCQQPPEQQPPPLLPPEEYQFLHTFEQHYGEAHPFFYACSFADALRLAEAESKFVFLYLHDPAHPYTASFCGGTLCLELVTQFLDANFVSWGACATVGEGTRVAQALRAPGFPFCAVVAPASGDTFAVLQQVEGPVSPSQLVEILQRASEEQGSAFRSSRTQEEAVRMANRQLREEQDAAYLASLRIDEKEGVRELLIEDADPPPSSAWKKKEISRSPAPAAQRGGRARAGGFSFWGAQKEIIEGRYHPQSCQIMIRFPNGERRQQSFLVTDRIRSIYRFIDSLDMPGLGSYRLIANFPKRVFGDEQLDMPLRDAALHQRATLFLELLE
ncbi:hypothetical protein Taro_039403 [Colocasia esculenta]|uniref:UBX domain-containing protein n=1 Tax=Colocasia esculenta TaxID=4460 RepID=A0A843WFN8_COLES|nr:hypothetical protein [Colocasia esculenta]